MPDLYGPEALLAAIVASSDDAIISKDLNGYVTSWNQGAERIFGYTAAEMIGRHITTIIPVDRHTEEDYVLGRVRSGIGVDHFETVRQRKDGGLIDVSLTVSPVRGITGQIVGASKIARDITEQKRLQRAVEEASRAKDEFLAMLSHELRTPLNAVLGYTHMMRTGAVPPDDLGRVLEVIGRNAETLTTLVNDVLDTSRIVTGKMRLVLQDCDAAAVVDEAIASVLPAARARGITVVSEIDKPITVRGDPDRLRQIMWNLLSNSVKFTDEGGSLRVSAQREERQVRLIVEDTGIGISPEALPNVFRRFWQADPTHTRAYGGLGLGLALARDFVELHGGRLEVRSEGVGRGTRFDVVLPTASVSSPASVAL